MPISIFTPSARALLLCTIITPCAFGAEDPRTGEAMYRKQCASCHGGSGEGTKKYPHFLSGDGSLDQLIKIVAKTMPEDKPGTLSAEEAQRVSTYVYEAFYSKAAPQRNQPPRIELARLTVGQYRNTLADLVGSFRTPGKWDDQRGLRGEYFNARGFDRGKRLIERIDPEVHFDFGTTGPGPGEFDAHQFCIRWEGSVLAPETGDYEFSVRTEHAVRLWINDAKEPLVDAWVKSGNDLEHRGSLFLLAGRIYPLRLEFSKAKQGVDDSKKNKDKPAAKASIELKWKQPRRVAEVIPARNLLPSRFPEVFTAATAFPPDDRSLGWERGTTVSKAWDQAETDAAVETMRYVAGHLDELAGTKPAAPDREAKVREFGRRWVERAFRRPLSAEQKKLFVDRPFEATKDPDAAIQRIVLLALKSPRFLYREAIASDAYAAACRLSYALWDSAPDAELSKAADEGRLKSREQVAQQAERMLSDPRALAKLHEFFLVWLKVDQIAEIAKDGKRFPGFDPSIVADLRTSLELFIEDVLWSPSSDFRQLLLADELYLNAPLAKFYGLELPANAPFQKMRLNPEQRAGVLTHPYLLSNFAYAGSTSPIHRGVFLTRGILGLTLRPPPEAFTPLAEDLHPKLTTRERVVIQTKPAACQSCHAIINPLGFALEHFDAVGRYRQKDNNQPIDSAGAYVMRSGRTTTFKDVRDLAKFFAASEEVHNSFVEQLFHHLVKQPIRAYGPDVLPKLRQGFAANDFHIRKLAVDIAVTAALQTSDRPALPAPKPPKK